MFFTFVYTITETNKHQGEGNAIFMTTFVTINNKID